MNKISLIQNRITNEGKRLQIKELQDYLQANLNYLVNYGERGQADLPFTSDATDFHINDCINARYSKRQTRHWTQQGAHNTLQIRAMMASHEWNEKFLGLIGLNQKSA